MALPVLKGNWRLETCIEASFEGELEVARGLGASFEGELEGRSLWSSQF